MMKVLVILSVICFASALAASQSKVISYMPTYGRTSGGETITIAGCGFREYAGATCWFGPWGASMGMIIDDHTIHCVTPAFGDIHAADEGVQDIANIPGWVDLTVSFDGESGTTEDFGSYTYPKFWIGPHVESISPTRGPIGGGAVTLTGWGFSDVGTATVWFDEVAVVGTIAGDNTITATAPAGRDFNGEKMVSVTFMDDAAYYRLAPHQYTYGPYISSISCLPYVKGTNTITVTGQYFTDFGSTVNVNVSKALPATTEPQTVTGTVVSNTQIVFTTPTVEPTAAADFGALISYVFWGLGNDEVAYRESVGAGKNPTWTLAARPDVTSVTPTQGHLGGGDLFTVHGCGFTNFTAADIEVRMSTTAICTNDTIVSFTDTEIVCKTINTAFTCNTAVPVSVAFTYESVDNPVPTASTIMYTFGPQIHTSTVSATRGRVAGGDVLTVTGDYLEYQSGVTFPGTFCTFLLTPPQTVNATRSGNTLSCTTPGLSLETDGAAVNADITWKFGTTTSINNAMECDLPTTGRPNWLWYPVCDNISPTYGALAGGVDVTVTGAGWSEFNYAPEASKQGLSVIFEASGGVHVSPPFTTLTWEQAGTDIGSVTETSFTVKTPINRYAERGGFRKFGSIGTIKIYLNATQTFPANRTNIVSCAPNDVYRYGPIVTGNSPGKGPIGPAGASSPGQAVTVFGGGLTEFASFDHSVSFGQVHQDSSSFPSLSTRWADFHYSNERAGNKTLSNTFQDVKVWFDVCNATLAPATHTFKWGPGVTGVGQRWGYHPTANKQLTVNGYGFNEYTGNKFTVLVGEKVCTGANAVDDNTITCNTPDHQFGVEATVRVAFGNPCGSTTATDFARILDSPESVYYMPRITQLNPTFGKVSGGDPVTITGVGFTGFTGSVYVGDHVSPQTAIIGSTDTTVEITTPHVGTIFQEGRAKWNDDVLVSMAFNGNDDWRIWYGNFHYGPVCSGVVLDSGSRNYGKVAGNEVFRVLGGNFHDVDTFRENATQVSFGSTNFNTTNDGTTLKFITEPTTCGTSNNLTISFQYPGQQVMQITCPSMYFGPVITTTQATLSGSCTSSARGWRGDTFVISGDLLDETEYGAISATIGSAADTSSVSSTSVTVTVPTAVTWSTENSLIIDWPSCPPMTVGTVKHYPVWTSINPTVGYVEGTDDLTIIGANFDCFVFTTGTPDDYAVGWGGSRVNASSVGNTFIIAKSPGGVIDTTAAISVFFNQTKVAVSRSVLEDGSTAEWYFGPLVTGITPSFGNMRGDESFTIQGMKLDDPYFNQTPFDITKCVFGATTAGGHSYPLVKMNATQVNTPTTIVCKTPEFMGPCPRDIRINAEFNKNGSLTERPKAGENLDQTFRSGALITGISTTFGKTEGGDAVTFTGLGFDSYFEDTSNDKARCIFDNIHSDLVTVSSATSITCTTPAGAFGKIGGVSIVFNENMDALTTVTAGWHWHAYSDNSLSISDLDYAGFETIYAQGGGFCGYDWVTADLAGTQGFVSQIATNWQVMITTQPRMTAGGPATITFCDSGLYKCSCDYMGTPDTLAAGIFNVVNVPPPPPTNTTASTVTVTTVTVTTNVPPTTGNTTTNITTGNGTTVSTSATVSTSVTVGTSVTGGTSVTVGTSVTAGTSVGTTTTTSTGDDASTISKVSLLATILIFSVLTFIM